jgi:hypothetical protein
VDVAKMYDIAQCRPNYSNKLGMPIFLARVG